MTEPQRPFLTARWTELLMLNFAVPTEAVADLAPPGTEPDLFNDQAYISVVGFQFRDTRVRGWSLPRHTHFPEINLRYYVRRIVGDDVRRGVVFVREIVPRYLIAAVANGLYHENYVCRPMQSTLVTRSETLAPGDRISYAWRSNSRLPLSAKNQRAPRWNTLAARVAAPHQLPNANSLEEFIVEHYWGYARGRDGRTREYRVAHDPWRVAPGDDVIWDCDVAATYHTPLAKYLMTPPLNALIADGATVAVMPGSKIPPTAPSPSGRGPG